MSMRIMCPECRGELYFNKIGSILHDNVITRKYVCKKCSNLVQTEERVTYSEKRDKKED